MSRAVIFKMAYNFLQIVFPVHTLEVGELTGKMGRG
jgi:hypothetical protein